MSEHVNIRCKPIAISCIFSCIRLFTELLQSATDAPEIEFNPEVEWQPMKEKEHKNTANISATDIEMIGDGVESDQGSSHLLLPLGNINKILKALASILFK